MLVYDRMKAKNLLWSSSLLNLVQAGPTPVGILINRLIRLDLEKTN